MECIDQDEFHRALSRFVTGVTVVTSRDNENNIIGMTANSFTSVSLSPPTILLSVMRGRTLDAIQKSARFAVNVLPVAAKEISGHFAGNAVPGLIPRFEKPEGMPKLEGTVAFFDCQVDRLIDVNDHTLLIGSVLQCTQNNNQPLVFYSSKYCELDASSN